MSCVLTNSAPLVPRLAAFDAGSLRSLGTCGNVDRSGIRNVIRPIISIVAGAAASG
ncbi:MAG TPA: hypothetical protein PLI18_19970 [Pirellulaceae bacterium]|nr:hypothetical protein [Pirellulaceae bacterium]